MTNTKLSLTHDKPIVFLKIETTGSDFKKDKIVEISLTKVMPDGKTNTGVRRFNPGTPIHPDATKVHGISDKDIESSPTFKTAAENISDFLNGCDICGFGVSSFDIPILSRELGESKIPFVMLHRRVLDMNSIFKMMEPRDLIAAALIYAGENIKKEDVLNAEKTNKMNISILEGMMKKYQDKLHIDWQWNETKYPKDFASLCEIFNGRKNFVDAEGLIVLDKNGKPIFSVGKHKGLMITSVMEKDMGYIDWVLKGQNELSFSVKFIVEKLKEQFEKRKQSVAK